jgi:hypothetical protein
MPDYPALARAAGDPVNVDIIENANHGDFMKTHTVAFEAVRRAALRVLAR